MNPWLVFSILFIILIVIEGYNALSLKELKKLGKSNDELKSQNYYDLKYKFQLFTAIGTIIVFLVTFFGWSTQKSIHKDLLREYNNLNDSINDVRSEIDVLKNHITNFPRAYVINNMEVKRSKKSKTLFDGKLYRGPDTIYFKNCIDIDGNKLPKFTYPPVISFIISGNSNLKSGDIEKVTTDYFSFYPNWPMSSNDSLDDYPGQFIYEVSFMVMDFKGTGLTPKSWGL